jgi:hypothetical protein
LTDFIVPDAEGVIVVKVLTLLLLDIVDSISKARRRGFRIPFSLTLDDR